MKQIPVIRLANGVEMPQLGYGVLQLRNAALCENCVFEAIRMGYRLIDTAAAYGNEEAVGKAAAKAVLKGIISREDLFLTTKVWIQDYGEGTTRRAVLHSMEKLGTDRLDLVLLHQPFGDFRGAWKDLEELFLEGKIRAIGTSNFIPEKMAELLQTARIRPMVNQMEIHPFFAETKEAGALGRCGIQPEAWGPFCEGQKGIFENPILSEIGKTYHKSAAQTALRWNLQQGHIVVTGTRKKEHMEENLQVFDFSLSQEDIRRISLLDTGRSEIIDLRSPSTERLLLKYHIHQ